LGLSLGDSCLFTIKILDVHADCRHRTQASLGLLATAKLLVSTQWCLNVCGTYHYQFVFDSLKCIHEQL